MQPRQIVVIGASAGGLDALRLLLAALPAEFPAPIAVVMHTSPQSPGVLHEILDRAGPLRSVRPRNGEKLRAGTVYVAPPDLHLLIEPGRVRVTKGPKEHRFRPAIDPLFRSAAQVYGPAVVGVILTGNLDDGTAGLWVVKQLGGTAIVQDPSDALFPSMPTSALNHVNVDHSVPLAEVAPLLMRLTAVPEEVVHKAPPAPDHLEIEVKIAKEHGPLDSGLSRVGKPSTLACPECHGVLLKIEEGGRIRFRCHTGHAYSAESLRAAISEGIEESLWGAMRALEEGAMLMEQMSEHVRSHAGAGRDSEEKQLSQLAGEARRQSDTIRRLLSEREPLART